MAQSNCRSVPILRNRKMRGPLKILSLHLVSFYHPKQFHLMCHLNEVNHPERVAGRIGKQSLNPDGAEKLIPVTLL